MENKSFQQQVAIVSGAGKGIGFAIARQLAAQGANVVINDIDIDLANAASLKITDEGGSCVAFGGDISEIENIEGIVTFAVEKFGKLDILFSQCRYHHLW
jgi:3-oxoacyl-[acyl-carrier protein] reductase